MDWVMQNKGDLPPQIFIIQVLEEYSKTINMTGDNNDTEDNDTGRFLHNN